MTDIRDNPPPLPDTASLAMSGRSTEYIDGYESGFERCKAAMQGEIDDYEQELLRLKHDKDELLAANAELRAKIRAMEEQNRCNCTGRKHHVTTGGWDCPVHGHQL